MGAIGILPIIIVLLLIGLLIFLISKGKRNEKRRSSSKKRPLFFIVYLGILTIALIVFLVVPNNKIEKLEVYEGDYAGGVSFYAVMDQSRSIDEIAEFKQTEKSYPLSGDQLDFSEAGGDSFNRNISILLVKDPSLTDTFLVESYETPFIYGGYDISEFLHPVEIGGNDGVVHIRLPRKETVLSMYDYAFPFKQFSGDSSESSMFDSYRISSDQLIVIYIPEHVTPNVAHITGDSFYHVEMITKE